MSGHFIEFSSFTVKTKGKQKRRRGQKTQKSSEFLRFLPSSPFCFHDFIDTIARIEKVSRHQLAGRNLISQPPVCFSNFFNRSNSSGKRANRTCDLRQC